MLMLMLMSWQSFYYGQRICAVEGRCPTPRVLDHVLNLYCPPHLLKAGHKGYFASDPAPFRVTLFAVDRVAGAELIDRYSLGTPHQHYPSVNRFQHSLSSLSGGTPRATRTSCRRGSTRTSRSESSTMPVRKLIPYYRITVFGVVWYGVVPWLISCSLFVYPMHKVVIAT